MTYLHLDHFVLGRPAPFATAGERPWKEAIAVSLVSVESNARGAFLELDFAVAPVVVDPRGADLRRPHDLIVGTAIG